MLGNGVKKKTILFRVDASKKIGLGHIMRCMSLAGEAEKRDYRALFVVRRYDGISEKSLKERRFRHVTIKDDLTEDKEAEKIVSLAREYGACSVVFDRYDLTNGFISDVKRSGRPVFLIDDRNYLVEPDVAAIINGNVLAEELDYRIREKTGLFLGTKYFLIERCFAGQEEISGGERNVTVGVCMSSMDYHSIKALMEFLRSFVTGKIAVVFTAAQKKEMRSMKKEYKSRENITIHYDLDSVRLADLMKNSRLFFTGGGTMMYQAMAAGCAVFAVPVNGHQERNISSLVKRNAVRLLGKSADVFPAAMKEIESVINDPGWKLRFQKEGTPFIDGKGTERVADIICR